LVAATLRPSPHQDAFFGRQREPEADGVRASAIGIDRVRQRVLVEERPPLAYDLLSIDVGATPALDAIPGAAEHALPVKPIGRFLACSKRCAHAAWPLTRCGGSW
jgi:NADH dehydrogenase FAD-containing subunit